MGIATLRKNEKQTASALRSDGQTQSKQKEELNNKERGTASGSGFCHSVPLVSWTSPKESNHSGKSKQIIYENQDSGPLTESTKFE